MICQICQTFLPPDCPTIHYTAIKFCMCHYILAQGQSCDGCISTTAVCMTKERTYLSFTLLFNESLIDSGCELVLNDIPKVITEQSCVELSSNLNYSIWCPLCPEVIRYVNYVIPNSIFTNVEDCFDSGTVVINT